MAGVGRLAPHLPHRNDLIMKLINEVSKRQTLHGSLQSQLRCDLGQCF